MAWSPTGSAQDAATLAPFSPKTSFHPVPAKTIAKSQRIAKTALPFPPSFLLTPLELWLPLRAHLRARSNTWATRWRTKW